MIPIRYNLRGLMVRKTSTIASAFGIGMVVFVLASAMMLSSGVQRTLGKSGRPDTAIVLRKGSDAEMMSTVEETSAKLILAAPGIRKGDDGQPLSLGEIVVVVVMEKANGAGSTNITVRGVQDHVLKLRPEVRLVDGRPAQPGTNEVIIGQRLLHQLQGMALGQAIELRKNRPAHIVGVFADGGSSFESEIWAGVDAVRSAFGRGGVLSSVRVRLESAAAFDGFQTYVEQDKRLGLMAMRESTYYEKQSEGTSLFIRALGLVIALFCSLGAMIGAMITMYGSISDRRREIGVLRALGFSRRGVLCAFLLEAILLALLGGLLGVGGALSLGAVRFSVMNFQTFSELIFTLTPTTTALSTALVAAGVMGLLGGFFPALRAARVSPIQAMRG